MITVPHLYHCLSFNYVKGKLEEFEFPSSFGNSGSWELEDDGVMDRLSRILPVISCFAFPSVLFLVLAEGNRAAA